MGQGTYGAGHIRGFAHKYFKTSHSIYEYCNINYHKIEHARQLPPNISNWVKVTEHWRHSFS